MGFCADMHVYAHGAVHYGPNLKDIVQSSSIFRSLADLRHGGVRFKQEGDFSTSHTCLVVFYCPTAKTSVFIEVLTLGEDQSIRCIRTRSFLLHPKILEFTLLLP